MLLRAQQDTHTQVVSRLAALKPTSAAATVEGRNVSCLGAPICEMVSNPAAHRAHKLSVLCALPPTPAPHSRVARRGKEKEHLRLRPALVTGLLVRTPPCDSQVLISRPLQPRLSLGLPSVSQRRLCMSPEESWGLGQCDQSCEILC